MLGYSSSSVRPAEPDFADQAADEEPSRADQTDPSRRVPRGDELREHAEDERQERKDAQGLESEIPLHHGHLPSAAI